MTTGDGILAELRELLGEGLLSRFLAVFAATHVVVGKTGTGATFRELERVIGTEAAQRLKQRFGGDVLYVPGNSKVERDQRNAEILARLSLGESPRAIARSFRNPRLSTRQVQRIAKRLNGPPAKTIRTAGGRTPRR